MQFEKGGRCSCAADITLHTNLLPPLNSSVCIVSVVVCSAAENNMQLGIASGAAGKEPGSLANLV
jgi:hypothetical protein